MTPTQNKHLLTLALTALLGTSAAATAQSQSGSAEAKVRTDATAEAAVEDADAVMAASETRQAVTAPPPPPSAPAPMLAAEPVAPVVTFTSSPPDSVVGDYSIDFAAMDGNGDGVISRSEARVNATLTAEFDAVDRDRNGRLGRDELSGWIK